MSNRQFVILLTAIILGSLVIVAATLWVGDEQASANAAHIAPPAPWEGGIQNANY